MNSKLINLLKKSNLLKAVWKMPTRIQKGYWYKFLYPLIYKLNARAAVDPDKVIFVERRYDTIQDSLKLLYGDLKKNYDFTIHTHCLNQDFASSRSYRRSCRRLVRDLATAGVVFLSDANEVVSCLPLRKDTKVTQTWHACGAFKRFGISTGDYLFGESTKEQRRFPKYKNLSLVTVSSPEVVWAYEEAMDLRDHPGVVSPVGVSRTDVFFDRNRAERAYQKLYHLFPAAKGKKVILYAPTYRGWASRAQAPDRLDYEMFSKALGDSYVMVVKQHPLIKSRPPIEGAAGDFARDLSESLSIEDLLMVSDICISDYSSIIFEYALLERPMLFFAYDLDDYNDWRGFYYPFEEMTPGPVCTTNEEMIQWIAQIDETFDRETVTAFREKFMSACDGHATRRILEKTFGASRLDCYHK